MLLISMILGMFIGVYLGKLIAQYVFNNGVSPLYKVEETNEYEIQKELYNK